MTLVLTFMSREHAVMVSDTRLCIPDPQTGQLTPLEGDAVKFEYIRGLMFCFAGVANFTRIPTRDWLRQRFENSQTGFEGGLSALAKELDSRFERKDLKGLILTVTIVGWVLDEDGKLTPVIATVTNQDPRTFAQLASFKHMWSPLEGDGGWVSTGQLSASNHAQLQQALETELRRPVTPDVIANAFLVTLRAEAAQNVTVGDKARVATLPLQALEHALGQDDSHIMVWKTHEPVLIDGQPTVLELQPNQLTVETVTVDEADLSKAVIVN